MCQKWQVALAQHIHGIIVPFTAAVPSSMAYVVKPTRHEATRLSITVASGASVILSPCVSPGVLGEKNAEQIGVRGVETLPFSCVHIHNPITMQKHKFHFRFTW